MSVVFKPWIGEQYFLQTPKILILGESHYLEEIEQDLENYTIRVVRELGLREKKKYRFFTIIAKIVSRKHMFSSVTNHLENFGTK